MEELLISLVSGAVGGNLAGFAMKNKSLGVLWNTVAGLVGGGLGGQLLGMLGLGGDSIGANVAGSGVGGAVIMLIVAVIKGAMKKA